MVFRSSVTAFAVLAGLFFAFALAAIVGTCLSSPVPVLHDVASVLRMPVPGKAETNLSARGYGLYFGLLNAPQRRVMRAPKLNITIVPPGGSRDPEFVEVPPRVDVFVNGFHTVQVARIAVSAPGRYHVEVDSPEESGGSFSIGELPEMTAWDRGLARAAPGIIFLLSLSAVMTVIALLLRRRGAAWRREASVALSVRQRRLG